MKTENTCPVCGYQMEAPPKNYRICPSCGTEFGVNDVNASIAELREAWMKTGPQWWGDSDLRPADWDPMTQMENAGIVVKRPAASQPSTVSTATASRTIGGSDWGRGLVAAPAQSRDDRSPSWVCD
jgi:hypothetical protein